MTRPFSRSPEQRDKFERRGVVRLEGLLGADGVRRARELILRRLGQAGVTEAGGWRAPDARFKVSEAIGGPHAEIEALGEEPALLAAVDELLGGRAFETRLHKRPRVLVTLPDAAEWVVPTGWHMDAPRLASGEGLGIQLFAMLDDVEPGGGGTLVVAGSHRLLDEGRFMRMKEIRPLLRRHAFFRRLYSESPADSDDRASLMSETFVADGVELKIMEMTGRPGDAYFTDLRIAHTTAPNASRRPRMMITRPFERADLMREVAEGFGWV